MQAMMIQSDFIRASCFLALVVLLSYNVNGVDSLLNSKSVPSIGPTFFDSRGGGTFFKRRSKSTEKEDTISLNDNNNGDSESIETSPYVEREKANEVIYSCAKITAVSAIVDFAVDGTEIFVGIGAAKWILPLTTLWKISFAYNMFRVSRLYRTKTENAAELFKGIETLMTSMTGVWRRLAFMVALLTVDEVVLAWKDSLPLVREGLTVLFGIVGVVTMYLSTKETQTLRLAPASLGSMSENENPAQRIARVGKITVQSMLLGVSALLLDSIFIPVIAFSKKSWRDAIGELLNVPTSLTMTTLLWKLRKSFVAFIEDVTNRSSSSDDWTLDTATQVKLAVAQQKFWSKVKSCVRFEMISKIVAAVIQLKLFQTN